MKFGYLLIVIIVVGALAVSVPVLDTTKEDFSTYNQDWNGCSHVKELASQEGYTPYALFSLDGVRNVSDAGVLIMLNPSSATSVTDQDISTVKSFVERGGSLVLANDFGSGNAVIQGLGLEHSMEFSGLIFEDNVTNWADATHPLVTDLSPSNATSNVHVLYFNYPTTLNVTDSRVDVLARSASTSTTHSASVSTVVSSPVSTGAQPVLASLSYGKGRIVLLSDPSLFINGMLDKGDNEALFTSLMGNLTHGVTAAPVIFDESHRTSNPPLILLYDTINADDTVKYVVVVLSMAAVVAGINVATLKRKPRSRVLLSDVRVNDDAAVEDLIEAHPTWRRTQVKRFLKGLQSRRRRRHGDRK